MNRFFPISPTTQVCAVIGEPLKHSLSPLIHNAAFRELGLDYVYIAFPVQNLRDAMVGMGALGNFRGLSVTIPHKVEVMQYVDHLNERDRSVGSINTVIKNGNELHGLGTDGPGALKALENGGFDSRDKRVLILGAGGVARAIGFTLALESSPKSISILDIDAHKSRNLARHISANSGVQALGMEMNDENLSVTMEEGELIVNCTPLGMSPNMEESPVPARLMRKGQTLFDVVYNPLNTRFLRDGESLGLLTISGVEMFINQAALQFEAFTGRDAPVEVMRQVVMEALER